ncbi:MAG: cell division protein ZapA [Arcicella sp.]|nr:cell division protein ZapA [Arcicella sp.]
MTKPIPCNILVGTEAFSPTPANVAEEEIIRKAAKLINEKIQYYQERNGIKSTQRLLALSALDVAMSILKTDMQNDSSQKIVLDRMSSLESIIDTVID